MNLAIVIGVAAYKKPVTDLPACMRDVDLVSQLLRYTNKFPNMLELGKNTSSAEIKTQLAQFITKFRDEPVDELFFYYSGHGDLYKDDFYFLLSDFDEKRRNQTSLTNDELDSMLRTVSPKLVVKVVDACHAGVSYVKEPDALAKQLQTSKGSFSNCYFMFSSQSSQSSFQDEKLSDFTETFVEACSTFTGQDIRYKDIVDHISDAFTGNADQTPTFVIQAPCVEIFWTINKSIRKLLPKNGQRKTSRSEVATPVESEIAEAIKSGAQEFSRKEDVWQFISTLGTRLKDAKFRSELKDAYKLVAETSDTYQGIPNLGPVGQWVKENGADFFATPQYKTEAYEAPEIDPLSIYRLQLGSEKRMVTKYRQVITGFDCTAEVPFKSIRITAYPTYENLPHAVAIIVFVFSKRDFASFSMFQPVKEIDWGKLAELEARKWIYMSVVMKRDPDAVKTADDILHRFEGFLTKSVQEKLNLSDQAKQPEKKTGPETKTKEKERAAK